MTHITLLFVNFVIPTKKLENSSPRVVISTVLCTASLGLLALLSPAE